MVADSAWRCQAVKYSSLQCNAMCQQEFISLLNNLNEHKLINDYILTYDSMAWYWYRCSIYTDLSKARRTAAANAPNAAAEQAATAKKAVCIYGAGYY